MAMKLNLVLLFLLCPWNLLLAQSEQIYLGKKGNVIWDKEISSGNLESIFTYYYPIYHKTSSTKNYERTGVFGKKIESKLNLNLPEVSDEFKQYKNKKKWSYILLGGAVTCISAWAYTSASYMDRTKDYKIGAFFKPQHLPLLGGYFACFYGSIHLNLKGDRNLKNAVFKHNRNLRKINKDYGR